MPTSDKRPVAFYHNDGLVAAWNHASRFAGVGGHVATLPEIIELRLGTDPQSEDSAWKRYYTSASAEYVGVGADGRIKIIVGHGVGPMSTIDGIKAAYKWEYGDKSRRRNGGRITAKQFLDLEDGTFGEVRVLSTLDLQRPGGRIVRKLDIPAVTVLDFQEYTEAIVGEAFRGYLTAVDAARDPLIRMRLGTNGHRYLMQQEAIAKRFHRSQRPNRGRSWAAGFDDRAHPYITMTEYASNCPYVQRIKGSPPSQWLWEPRRPEEGYALAHLLDIDQNQHVNTGDVGAIMLSSPNVHEWWNGARFIGVPKSARLTNGLADGPNPSKVLHEHWEHFLEPVDDGYVPIEPFLLEETDAGWFTCYPKQFPNDYCMDDGDIEFRVLSVERVGEDGSFMTDDDFFLRYKLSQISDIMPRTANAYEITEISRRDSRGFTTVTVRFYHVEVDTSKRLPKADNLARDYDRLMEVYTR